MDRRNFLRVFGASVAWSASASAQPVARSRSKAMVGFVGFASASVDAQNLMPFREAIRTLGYVEGQTIAIEMRSTQGDPSRGRALISELAALPVDVFLSAGPAATRAIARTTSIPVVAVALPAAQNEPELFSSFARPGGSVTGFSAFGEEMSIKRIEMLKEMVPGIETLGVLHNATDPSFRSWGEQTIADAKSLGLECVRLGLDSPSQAAVADHFRTLRDRGGSAVIVIRDFLTATMMDAICKIGLASRIAVVGEYSDVARSGALFSYGADVGDLFRRAAGYVDRILKGEKAGELPIQLPTKFQLSVNAKTARALGLDLPQTMIVLADELIE